MAPSLSAEFLLVAACAVWPSSHSRIEAIAKLVAGPLDWEFFQQLVRRHRVAGLAHDGLTHVRSAVPAETFHRISQQATASAGRNLQLAAEAVRLQNVFAEAGLTAIFMKGGSLAILAYGNLGLRQSRDIDLLVHADSVQAASAVLERAGYRRIVPAASFSDAQLGTWLSRCKELRYKHKEKRVEVELHARLFDNPQLMAQTPTMKSLRVVPLSASTGLCTFGDDDLFAYLCAHGAFHCWFRLMWLADIAALLARQPVDNIEPLYRSAVARGAGRSAAQAFLLCRQLLGTTLPDQLAKTLSEDTAVRWLERMALTAMTAERTPTERTFGTVWNSISRFLLDPNWRYWLAELRINLISPVDILMLPLARRLALLYPLLRLPLWLWRHMPHRAFSRK